MYFAYFCFVVIWPYLHSPPSGILNIWTPVHPDGCYRLNLSAWDNREAAKMLFKLAEIEPGENLVNETFRPSLIEDQIPGWELPMPWTVRCNPSIHSYTYKHIHTHKHIHTNTYTQAHTNTLLSFLSHCLTLCSSGLCVLVLTTCSWKEQERRIC